MTDASIIGQMPSQPPSSPPLRVAQVMAGAEKGGAESFFERLTCGLNQLPGLTEKAFIRNHPARVTRLQAAQVDTATFRFGGRLDWFDRADFRRALLRFEPQVVMTWMGRASSYTPPGDYTLVSRLGHFYDLKYYRHADYWVGNTRGICDYLVQGGMPASKVFYIPNFVDEAPVQPLPRSSFNTPPDRPLLLAAGRLHTNKAFDVLLEALVQVPDAILWLAGSGPEENSLKTLAAQLGLTDRVKFLGWRGDITALMRSVDLFVCPSRHEGLGSIVLESWAHCCPIVATRSQGPAELIRDGITGLLTPIDQARPLADAIRLLLKNAPLRKTMTESALADYQQDFSEAQILARFRALYQQVRHQ